MLIIWIFNDGCSLLLTYFEEFPELLQLDYHCIAKLPRNQWCKLCVIFIARWFRNGWRGKSVVVKEVWESFATLLKPPTHLYMVNLSLQAVSSLPQSPISSPISSFYLQLFLHICLEFHSFAPPYVICFIISFPNSQTLSLPKQLLIHFFTWCWFAHISISLHKKTHT